LQVVNGGSNLSYGIRTLYAKQFEKFDKWLTGDIGFLTKFEMPDVKDAGLDSEFDADVEEAAAILESLGGSSTRTEVRTTVSKKRKSDMDIKDVNGKVRADAMPCAVCLF
jgi:hypothetical protein